MKPTITKSWLKKIQEAAASVAGEIRRGDLVPGCGMTHTSSGAPCCTLGHFYHRLGVLENGPENVLHLKYWSDISDSMLRGFSKVSSANDEGDFIKAAQELERLPGIIENECEIIDG